jgi:glucose-6-phosphate isomerase
MGTADGVYFMKSDKVLEPFLLHFDLLTGFSDQKETSKRYLSKVKDIFLDTDAAEKLLSAGDPLVYEFYELGMPQDDGELSFGTSITYPGKVGNEYFMTKGHFHRIIDTAEIYYCLKGHGYMMMENPEGDWSAKELTPGKVIYVPKRYAHRSVNVGVEPFVTFFCFRGDAGHDYKTIETKGFRKLIVEGKGNVEMIDNPKWK